MGNSTTRNSHRLSTSTASNTERAHWGSGSAGLPAPPGKPILIPSVTEDSKPIIVGIRWERSSNNGGSTIIGYLVEHRRLGSPHWIRSSPGLCSFPELTLSGLEPGWRYQFRVRAQNAVGLSQTSELSDPLTVTLQRAASCAPCFILQLNDTIALENEQVEFIVHFTGTPIPKISWFKDGFEIFSSRRTKIITENGRSSLLVHQTALNDEGEIKCTATNRVGYVSTRAKLILEALPKIRLPRQYDDGLLFEKGETIKLRISVAGRPSPHVTWYHDGEIIIFDDRHIIESIDTGEYSITISTAIRKDRGEYMIKAMNKLGEDNISFLITVTDRPSAPGRPTIVMTLGCSVTLSWSEPEDDGGCKIGTYIIEYYRISWDVWLKAGTSRQTKTTLGDLIGDSEYKFRVKAENPYGISDPSEESDVIFISKTGKRSSRSEQTLDALKNLRKQQNNNREERFDKRGGYIEKSPKRTRSLTRDEAIYDHFTELTSKSVSTQRLISSDALVKSSRSDSRVTFANTVSFHIDKSSDNILIPLAEPLQVVDSMYEESVKIDQEDSSDDPDILRNPEYTNLKDESISPLPKIEVDQSHLTEVENHSVVNVQAEMPREVYDQDRINEEFMLVLYPDNNKNLPEENYVGNDLQSPRISLSLPELFSINYDVIEVLREAFSSTELLHEYAVERFYKAVAMEEMTNKNNPDSRKLKGNLDFFSNKLRSIHPQRTTSKRLLDQPEIQRMCNRRSSEGHAVSKSAHRTLNILSLQAPQLVLSDSNLQDIQIEDEFLNNILESSNSPNSVSLHRWDEKAMPLVSYSKSIDPPSLTSSCEEIVREENLAVKSSQERNYETFINDAVMLQDAEDKANEISEDLNSMESRIVAQSVVDNRYIHTLQEKSDLNLSITIPNHHQSQTLAARPNIQPKSILKKRSDRILPPALNDFGRPIPPEKFISESLDSVNKMKLSNESLSNPQYQSPIENKKQYTLTDLSDMMGMKIIQDIEGEHTNLMNAAEVAQNRRKLNVKYPLEKRLSLENEEDIEAQRAMISHYTEIMKEHTFNPQAGLFLQQSNRFTRRNSFGLNSDENLNNQDGNNSKMRKMDSNNSSSLASSTEVIENDKREIKQYNEDLQNTSSPPICRDVSVERKATRFGFSTIDSKKNNKEKSASTSSSKVRRKREVSLGRNNQRKSKTEKNCYNANRSTSINFSETSQVQNTDSGTSFNLIECMNLQRNRTIDDNNKVNEFDRHLTLSTKIKVQSTMSYTIDLTLFLAAVYIYFFKKEIFAIPFIGLVLYRRIQTQLINWVPHK